jgi:hypothetical protein
VCKPSRDASIGAPGAGFSEKGTGLKVEASAAPCGPFANGAGRHVQKSSALGLPALPAAPRG